MQSMPSPSPDYHLPARRSELRCLKRRKDDGQRLLGLPLRRYRAITAGYLTPVFVEILFSRWQTESKTLGRL